MGEPKGRSSFCPSFPSRPTRFERHKGVMRQMASGTGGWYGHSGTRGSKALQLFTTRVHGTAGGRQHRDMFRNLERQICYSSSQHFVCVFFVHEACVWFRAVSWFRVSCRRGVGLSFLVLYSNSIGVKLEKETLVPRVAWALSAAAFVEKRPHLWSVK